MMKASFLSLLLGVILTWFHAGTACGQGFTEPDVTFYGEVRKSGGGQTVLLQSGHLEMTFVNQSNAANRVTLETDLHPVGSGDLKPFSYRLKVPIAYLPEAPRIGEFLSVSTLATEFKIEDIKIDGVSATLPDGSKEFYGLSFASRSGEYRLDLLVAGDSTDTDHDGIPDWWEELFGLDPNLADAGLDPDGDGWTNLEEFRKGSHPNVSNRAPRLVTAQVVLPESGEAGVYFQMLDSDTPDSGIELVVTGIASAGFDLKWDGVVMPPGGEQHLSLADLKAGCLSIAQKDRSVRRTSLSVEWSDGGEVFSGEVLVVAMLPTVEDGSDASLWLDGSDLPVSGSKISSWLDRSGNGRSAMQPVVEYQPHSVDGSASFAMGSSEHLFFQDAALPTGNQTVFAAYRSAENAEQAQAMLSTNRGYLELEPTTQAVSYPGAPTYQMDGMATRGYENAAGTTTTSIFRREASVLESIFGLSYAGENVTATDLEPVLPTIGARRSAIPSGPNPVDRSFGGSIHELLVFPTALAEQKMRDVHDYLQSKWLGAVIWDFSTEFKPVTLTQGSGSQRRIVQGGFGDDQLMGGPAADIISCGAGLDVMTGGAGPDRFLIGGVDTGRKRITDFNLQEDIVDVSALFWGMTGDARQQVSVRLDTNYSTPVPTLDSVLVLKRPGAGTQEIVLENTVMGATQLIQMIVEGRLCMGALSVPTAVQLALAPGSGAAPLEESLDQSFVVNVTRSGAGTAGTLEVPLGFFEEALGGRFVVEGATESTGHRAVVTFARGEITKTVTVRPIPDLDTTGETSVQLAVLPQFRYAVGGNAVQQTVRDHPRVWLEVFQASAISLSAQPARIKVHRDGDWTQSLTVDFKWAGTALSGVHVETLPNSVTLPTGRGSLEIQILARAGGLTDGPKALLLQLASRDRYMLGDPPEVVVFVGTTAAETDGAGFDRWLNASTGGAIANLSELIESGGRRLRDYLQAYAFGLDSVEDLGDNGIRLRIVGGRPEVRAPGHMKAADLRWNLQCSEDMKEWTDAGNTFVQVPDPVDLCLLGEPVADDEKGKFYRLDMSVDLGQSAGTGIGLLTGANRYGMSGSGNWITDSASGNLRSAGGVAGEAHRVIAQVDGLTAIHFEMAVLGGNGSDELSFYVDGVLQTQTHGGAVVCQQSLTGDHLLMWEFTRGAGEAVIRNLRP